MSHITAVRDVLLNAAPVAALVGDRIYAGVLPPNAVLPALVLTVVTDTGVDTFTSEAASVMRNARIQVDCYAQQYADADETGDAVDDAMQASWGALTAFLSDRRDMFEKETRLHRISLDFSVWRGR